VTAATSELKAIRTTTLPRPLHGSLRFLRRKPVSGAAAIVLAVICALALLAPVLAPYDPNAVDLRARLAGPSRAHLLGADEFGRDVLSRVMYGGRVSLAAGLGATALGIGLGVLFGLLSGYSGGFVDLSIQRLMDAIMALPPIILLMVLSTMLSPNLRNVIIAIAVFVTPGASRVVRGSVLSVKEMTFVEAARTIGVGDARLLVRHVLPNVLTPIIVIATFEVARMIISESALSFLGLGVGPRTPSWGGMLADGRTYLATAWWVATFPGIAIMVTVLAINLLGDWLRDELDPRSRA